MIVVELVGGLGNQLFQFAAGRFLAEKLTTELMLDIGFLTNRSVQARGVADYRSFGLSIFNIKSKLAGPETTRLYGTKPQLVNRLVYSMLHRTFRIGPLSYIRETVPFRFNTSLESATDQSYLKGYWQSLGYIEPVADLLRQELTFAHALPAHSNEVAALITTTESVCLHVRRGDFVNNKRHEVVDGTYYRKAVEVLKQRVNDPVFIVFSDDINWCKQHLALDAPTYYVGDEHAGPNGEFHFQLMTRCRHFIIPNSTFSWWAAFLGRSENQTVVAPRIWLRERGRTITADELKPASWIQL